MNLNKLEMEYALHALADKLDMLIIQQELENSTKHRLAIHLEMDKCKSLIDKFLKEMERWSQTHSV